MPLELAPTSSADTGLPRLPRHLFHCHWPDCSIRFGIPNANGMQSPGWFLRAAVHAESSLPPPIGCRNAVSGTPRRSRRIRARVPPEMPAAWRWYTLGETRLPTPCCASRKTAEHAVPHPTSPLPQTSPPALPALTRTTAVRTLLACSAPVPASVPPRSVARWVRRSDAANVLLAVW